MYPSLHFGVFILLLIQFAKTFGDECPQIFKRYSALHSYCRPPSKTCKNLAPYPGQKDIQEILKLHNTKRSVVATGQGKGLQILPPAANMLQMEWDEELAAVAQKYAEQCLYEHDCPDCRRVMNFSVGQNIAKQIDSGFISDPDWEAAVNLWYDEIGDFPSVNVCPFKQPSELGTNEFRHFSQVSWAQTFRIGCGYVVYKEGPQFVRLYICNYGQGGNVYDACMYEAGRPCSHCPLNTCCGESCGGGNYPGLCKRLNDAPPSYPPPQNALLYCDFSDSNDCKISIEGETRWLIYSTLSGNYLEVVLKGGDSSTITFLKPLPASEETFCVSIKYRKGPTVDGNASENKVTGSIFAMGSNSKLTWELQDFGSQQRHQFNTYNMIATISNGNFPQPKQVSLSFEVPPGNPPQFFNVKEIVITSGACKS